MQKLTKKRSKKVGLPPGSLIHIGEKKKEGTKRDDFFADKPQ